MANQDQITDSETIMTFQISPYVTVQGTATDLAKAGVGQMRGAYNLPEFIEDMNLPDGRISLTQFRQRHPAAFEAAQESFARWFRQNYPGPDTVIMKPDWHSSSIFRAALRVLLDELTGNAPEAAPGK